MSRLSDLGAKYRDHREPHYIYRCYDAAGLLLYIGCTVDVKARMVVHRADQKAKASHWLRELMDHYEVDPTPHAGRIAGEAAERQAIRAEQPLLNVQHSGRPYWLLKIDLRAYLDARAAAVA